MVKSNEKKKKKKMKMVGNEKRPHFFKIVRPSLNIKHLRIPPDFMKHIAKEKCGRAILKGPCGSQWNIKLCKGIDGTYLQDGWQDFVQDHSLQDHEFLVFRYDGNMHFCVQIFDKTGCEREDLFSIKKQGKPQKKLSSSSCYEQGILSMRPIVSFQISKAKVHKKEQVLCLSSPRRRPATEEEKAKVWNAAKSFTSSRPYFIRNLNRSSVCHGYVLKIPSHFAKAHFPRHKTQFVLRVLRGKAWIVNFSPGKTCAFCGGWTAFARGNKLEEGDICTFELIHEFEISVRIFRLIKRVRFTSH